MPDETVEASGIISTVQIIELPVPTPTPGLAGGEWTSLTDPNQMNDLVVISNTIWIAGSGGAVAWTKGSSTPVIYTAPLREVSILIATLMGAIFLHEGQLRRRLPAAAAILLGVITLAVS